MSTLTPVQKLQAELIEQRRASARFRRRRRIQRGGALLWKVTTGVAILVGATEALHSLGAF